MLLHSVPDHSQVEPLHAQLLHQRSPIALPGAIEALPGSAAALQSNFAPRLGLGQLPPPHPLPSQPQATI